ncbi:MAG: hydroxypyruvate isomerase family protein [Verrucomicrobiae bacterium]|nr:hydroxypyruvate isomerase family protein [Verrucomicrobiae bacterium]
MLNFSANLTFLFPELGFLDRFAAAKSAGFDAVEYVCLYDHPAEVLSDAAKQAGVETILLNVPHGRWADGERGIAIFSDRVDEFRASLSQTIAYCRATGCRQVNCLAGIVPQGMSATGADHERLRAVFVDNLRYASAVLGEAGIRLLIEPINTRDIPGFFLSRTVDALSIIDDVGSDNLFLQFDCYHAQVMEGDLVHTIRQHLPRIGHVQIADNPGRNEPGTGEINYGFVLAELDRLGFAGYVGLEFRPRASTTQGLSWMASLRAPRA